MEEEGWYRGRGPAAGNMTSLLAATMGSSRGVAAGLLVSWGLGAALPCASAKRCRLLPEVFDGCSYVGRRLSPREKAIIKELLNETAFAFNFLVTGGVVGRSESSEKVEHSILPTGLTSPALHRLHSVTSDFRPPSVTESTACESCHRRLFDDFF